MKRFIEGKTRSQLTLMPECLEDYIGPDNPVRVVDAFVDALDLAEMGFDTSAAATGRPGYHPGLLLKLYIYGYLNRIQSSRRLERCEFRPKLDTDSRASWTVIPTEAGHRFQGKLDSPKS